LATQVAFKLTEKSKIAADNFKKEYEKLVTELYEAQTPQLVKDAYAKHREWFYRRSCVLFSGHGFQWEQANTQYPIICNNGTSASLQLTDKIAEKIMKAKRKYDKANDEYKQLKSETENALLALKSFKNIKQHFPDAVNFLPAETSTALVVNFDSLKDKLNRQPETAAAL
jgi:hypothetical protein